MGRFARLEAYRDHEQARPEPDAPPTATIEGDDRAVEFVRRFQGASFAHGAYRVHPFGAIEPWSRLAVSAFPELGSDAWSFASDWSGRQFLLAAGMTQRRVVLADVCSGEILETGAELGPFHEENLVADMPRTLRLPLYKTWEQAGGSLPGPSECVELAVPVFLGGTIDLANMQLTDMEVCWVLGAQLLRQARALPSGTILTEVHLSDGTTELDLK